MRKHFSTVIIAVFMAVLMVTLSPIRTYAASKDVYISDILMSDSIEKLEELGYTVLDNDLNAGTSWYDVTKLKTTTEYSYIGYKTTTNPDEAITDISIMDMKGGYSFGDYKEILKQREKEISNAIGMFRNMLKEFAANYKAGSPAAQKAYIALNNYVEDDSGRHIGDLFLDESLSDEDLIKIYMQSSTLVLYCLQTAVSIGLANYNSDNILEKLSALGPVETETDYFDEATELLGSVAGLRSVLFDYVNVGVDVKDNDAVEAYLDECDDEEAASFSQNAMLYILLTGYKYGDTTLAEFFMSDEISAEDLYPLVSVMTKGQYAAARINGFMTLFLSSENDAEAYTEAQQDLPQEIKETVEPISIYVGTDRSMYEGGVAITSDVKRKSASTGDTTWIYGNIQYDWELTLLIMGGVAALSTIILGTAGILMAKLATLVFSGVEFVGTLLYKFVAAVIRTPVIGWVFKVFDFHHKMFTVTTPWASVGAIMLYVSLAVLAFVVMVYFSVELSNYYHPTYTEIPLILMDLKFGESDDIGDWEKYIRYNVVRDEDGKAADLNCFMGKQWNAMYVTKDRAAGDPIKAGSFKVQYGDSITPRNYSPVHYFGADDAFNLNNHCYNDDVGGIFMFFRIDDKAFASETASVFGSGTLAALTGFGGVVIGALGAVLITKKKKDPTPES